MEDVKLLRVELNKMPLQRRDMDEIKDIVFNNCGGKSTGRACINFNDMHHKGFW